MNKKQRINILIPLILACLIEVYLIFEFKLPVVEADFEFSGQSPDFSQFSIVQNNSLIPISNPFSPKTNPIIIEEIPVIVTGYSSTTWETDDNPYLTAAGTLVREGIIANNFLPFGTKIRIPELFGDKIFVVEDRMSWEKGKYHIDIWFPSYWEAKNFGAKKAYIEILES